MKKAMVLKKESLKDTDVEMARNNMVMILMITVVGIIMGIAYSRSRMKQKWG
jgi:hypothetical protein